jgi:hypothetical protein
MRHREPPRAFPPVPKFDNVPGVEEARREQAASTNRFIEAAHRGPEVRRVSEEMKTRRIRNGYEELLEDALKLRRGKKS